MSSSSGSASASASSSHAAGLVDSSSNSTFKIVGIALAVGSGFLIGASFVIKKKGLLNSTAKYGNVAGEGHAYLKSWMWWAGMITMILGEVCNFVAYAFTEAILVTPMGALAVVVAAILSHFLLKEKLTFFGWIGCTLCIIGAVILALNAPEQQSVTTINEFKKFFLSVGFLVWASLLIVGSLVIRFFAVPRWGKKSMLPYISICSLIGGVSVSCTQGLGASIVTSIQGNNQVKNWFFWFLFVFVVVTLLIEINYLNKALELFNTSMVVPVYFCFFSSATLITSFILYQGLKASAVTLITMVLGFLVTCLGITLLQLSKVDPKQLDKLDRKSTILMAAAKHQTEDAEKGEVTSAEDPGMDALRGGFGAVGSIIRARSVSRRMSNASSMSHGLGGAGGSKMYGYSSGNLSTHGMGNLQRFQLTDEPMPSDAMDQISLHSAKSPSALSAHGFQSGHSYFPQRSKSQLKFEEADVVHQYHYGSAPDTSATHTYRPHNVPPSPGCSGSGDGGRGFMGMGHRQASAGSIYPPVPEDQEQEREDLDEKDYPVAGPSSSGVGGTGQNQTRVFTHVVSPPEEYDYGTRGQQRQYQDPYAPPRFPSTGLGSGSGDDKSLQPSHRGLSGLFQFNSGPDLSFHLGGRRRSKSRDRDAQHHGHQQELSHQQQQLPRKGSADREDKHEYPNLGKKDRNDQLEKEERAGLVSNAEMDSPDSYGSDDDDGYGGAGGEGGGISPMTMDGSHVGHDASATIGLVQRVNLAQPQSARTAPGSTSTGNKSKKADANANAGSAPMSYSTSAPESESDPGYDLGNAIPPSQSMGYSTSASASAIASALAGNGAKPQIRVDTSFSSKNSSPKGPRLLGSKGKTQAQGYAQGQDPPGFAGPRYQ
ncbi:hypothetical protein IAU59_002000 [Kwoniella sp. CBS 9459]